MEPKFTGVIQAPEHPEPPTIERQNAECCPAPVVDNEVAEIPSLPFPILEQPRDNLLEALPMVFAGVAIAFATGALIGVLISNPVMEQ